jgi:hypothetical protein
MATLSQRNIFLINLASYTMLYVPGDQYPIAKQPELTARLHIRLHVVFFRHRDEFFYCI